MPHTSNAGARPTDFDTYKELILADLEDSSYSDYSELRDRSMPDWEAAAKALWETGVHEVDVRDLLAMSRRQTAVYVDENHLACTFDQEYMDATDKKRFTAFLIDQITEQIAKDARNKLRKDGRIVVDTDHGIYVFAASSTAAWTS